MAADEAGSPSRRDPGTPPAAEIPAERLPPGFARRAGRPPESPATPRPAATVVLLRAAGTSGHGIEVLLVRRSRQVGFVPGAYVFPGGRVDPSDGDRRGVERLAGLDPEALGSRMEATEGGPSPAAFLVAAYRETFEETGLIPGAPAPDPGDPEARRLRDELLADRIPFHRVLEALDLHLSARSVAYIAHWVTPEAEPRRYDTRFFALKVPRGLVPQPDPDEITEALWIPPAAAVERHEAGELPMVFPTLYTLRELAGFEFPEEVVAHYRNRRIPRILPRLVRTEDGVGIQLPDPPHRPSD